MKAIILAGGLGTRLKERVPDLPKPMASVANRPFLEYLLDRIIEGGISEVIISVGHLANSIISHFGTSYKNVPITYAHEKEPLGTGGAIEFALQNLDNKPVLILNGDTLLNIKYQQLLDWYKQSQPKVAMVLRHVSNTGRFGSVDVNNDTVTGFHEKGKMGPGLINTGVYILSPSIYKSLGITGKHSFEVDILQNHIIELSPKAFITSEYFIDIGIPEEYERAQLELPSIS